jgi:hypothetical protein
VGAFTIPYTPALGRLFRQAIEHVAGESAGGLRLSVEPPFVRARGSGTAAVSGGDVRRADLPEQVGQDRWEGRLPDGLSGTVLVRKGRARASATIPCPPEFEKLGVDRAALDRMARETGGRVLSSPARARRPAPSELPAPRSGRTLFLIAALVLVFAEMAVSSSGRSRRGYNSVEMAIPEETVHGSGLSAERPRPPTVSFPPR